MSKYFIPFFLLFSILAETQVYAMQQVPAVIISDYANNQLHDLSLANTSSITQQQIEHSGAKTIIQLLNHRDGIQVQDLFGDGSHVSISMRGFGDNATNNVLIMIDGQPLLNPDLGAIDFNSLPLSDIERIDILPGSAGVLYGDQAVGGVINIITKKPHKFAVRTTVGLGSYGNQQYQASLANTLTKNLSYKVQLQHDFSKNYRDHNHHQLNQLIGQLNYHSTKNIINFRYQLLQNNLQYAGPLSAEQVMIDRRQANNNIDFNNEQKNNLSLFINHTINDNWHLLIDSAYNKMTGNGVLFSPFTENRYSVWLNPRLTGNLSIANLTALTTVGVSGDQANYTLNATAYSADTTQTQYAAYIDSVTPLGEQFKLNLGARHAEARASLLNQLAQQISHNRADISTMGLSWQPRKHFAMYIRRAGSYRFPKADENALSLNNMPLQTQLGYSYELGAKLTRKHYGSSISLYQLNVNNEIIFIPSFNNTSFGSNQNLPPTRRQGIILSSYVKPIKPWKITAEIDQVNAIFSTGLNQGKRIPFVANQTASLSSDFELNSHWDFYGEALYTGGRYPAGDQSNLSNTLPAFTIFNASLRYKYKRLTCGLRVNNITNKQYFSYALVAMRDSLQTFYYPANDRNYWFTISYAL